MDEKTKRELGDRFGEAARALDEHALVLSALVAEIERGNANTEKVLEIVNELREGMSAYLDGLDGVAHIVSTREEPRVADPADTRRVLRALRMVELSASSAAEDVRNRLAAGSSGNALASNAGAALMAIGAYNERYYAEHPHNLKKGSDSKNGPFLGEKR